MVLVSAISAHPDTSLRRELDANSVVAWLWLRVELYYVVRYMFSSANSKFGAVIPFSTPYLRVNPMTQILKMPPAMTDTLSERFLVLVDVCQKRFRQWHYQGSIITNLVSKARKKDRDTNAGGQEEPKLYLQEAVLERKLSDYDLRTLIELPPGLDYNEWLASHTIAFFEHVNLIYGTISEFCTISGCPDMIGPGLRQYLWFDEKGKKAKVAAPQYIDYVMTFIQKTVNDESIFPTKYANEFPGSFESIAKKIQRLVFHVLAHLYHSHFREILLLNLHSHLNCVFAHFIFFNERFKLIESREIDVLQDLVTALKLIGDENKENMVTSDGSDELTSSCIQHEQDLRLDGTLVLSQP